MDLNKIESLIEAIVSDLKNNLLKPMAKELEDHIEHLKVHIDEKNDTRFSLIEEKISQLKMDIESQNKLIDTKEVGSNNHKSFLLFFLIGFALQILTICLLVFLLLK